MSTPHETPEKRDTTAATEAASGARRAQTGDGKQTRGGTQTGEGEQTRGGTQTGEGKQTRSGIQTGKGEQARRAQTGEGAQPSDAAQPADTHSVAPLLELVDVSFSWSTQDVFDHLSLAVGVGELVVILGPSGCGKSTLLKVAASLLPPAAGTVRYRGAEVNAPSPERLLVFQDTDQLLPWKTARGNIVFALDATHRSGFPRWRTSDGDHGGGDRRAARGTSREKDAIAHRALAEVGLTDAAGRYPHQLSGGMRQRVALARAFAIEAPMLLLDEPFAAVDAPTRRRLGRLLRSLQQSHRPGVLFVTHDVEEALNLADRIIVMGRDGTLSRTFVMEERHRDDAATRSSMGGEMYDLMEADVSGPM